ncbi:hypothetical protein DL347_19025 [Pseudomonas fluorescens]|uniref:Uncharacterized protein n=1 Tax=Pseudomonas fluorescens TaxID=294 RepID=A0A7Z6QNF0_PSEFL|nr:hypothetical protein DL347_19025 [Pseudomonas fluorescens]
MDFAQSSCIRVNYAGTLVQHRIPLVLLLEMDWEDCVEDVVCTGAGVFPRRVLGSRGAKASGTQKAYTEANSSETLGFSGFQAQKKTSVDVFI